MDSRNLIRLRLCTLATLATLWILSLSHAQSGATSAGHEPDPWFEERRTASEDVEDRKPAQAPSRKRNARALHRKLIAQYEQIAENDLSERIATLQEAISVAPSLGRRHELTLDELKRIKAGTLDAIEAAGQADISIEKGIETLEGHAEYLLGDPSLSAALQDSVFLDKVGARFRTLGRKGELESIDRIENAFKSSAMYPVVGDRVNTMIRSVLTRIVERRWDSSSRSFQALTSEAFLVGRLTQSEDKKMALHLDFPPDADLRLRSGVQRSVESAWGGRFLVDSSGADRGPSDLVLDVSLGKIQTRKIELQRTVSSSIPGPVTEEPNPDFIAMLDQYKYAAKRYEQALKIYEREYDNFLFHMTDQTYNNAQKDLDRAGSSFAATSSNAWSGGASFEYQTVADAMPTAETLANSLSALSLPEPMPPTPHHHKILEELQLIPSTLLTQGKATRYEYTSTDLMCVFSSSTDIALSSPADETLRLRGEVSLKQERYWMKNEGVHPNDPYAEPGSYTEAGLSSALDLFGLDFGTKLAAEFGELLGQVQTPAPTTLRDREDLEALLLRLSLAARDHNGDPYSLSNDELKELAGMARSPDSGPNKFRLACLDRILRKSGLADSIPTGKLGTLL